MLLHRRQAIHRFIRNSTTYRKADTITVFYTVAFYKSACNLYMCILRPQIERVPSKICAMRFSDYLLTPALSLIDYNVIERDLSRTLVRATCPDSCEADHDDVVR
uniref:Uncharacterized protein n=1 Tax=Hyaloperonospora arabidopsidis (strain Emoy2) TaxID=559515 RepID=M4C3W9_HYAAE